MFIQKKCFVFIFQNTAFHLLGKLDVGVENDIILKLTVFQYNQPQNWNGLISYQYQLKKKSGVPGAQKHCSDIVNR